MKLVVFDLDFTLWDCGGTYCDCTFPPYSWKKSSVTDSDGAVIRLYDDVYEILEMLDADGVMMAIASRTTTPHWARELLDLLGIAPFFSFSEIYPDSKLTHFSRLHQQSGVPFQQMLFFDDEYRNIDEVGELGVNVVHVKNGLNKNLFDSGHELLKLQMKSYGS
mgnify:CR=1 FL=1